MIFDAHSDTLSDFTNKILKGENNIFKKYHYQNFIDGKIEGAIFVIWVEKENHNKASERVQEIQNSLSKELEYCSDVLKIVKNYDEMINAKNENKIYIFLGFESLISIGENLDIIDEYYEYGIRHASLTWNEENSLATGARGDSNRGLTTLGKKAIKKMNDKGIIIDVSHLNDKSFFDVIDTTEKTIIASHSNSRTLCNNIRNLTDEQLKAIRDLNGVIGFNSYKEFVSNDINNQNIDMGINHIKYIAEKIGVEHIGLGFDYNEYLDDDDEPFVKGLENASKSYSIIEKLKDNGFNKEEIEKIAYKNFHRVIKEILR